METNSYFTMGSSHIVCQDYARSGYIFNKSKNLIESHFAALSDGCSSSPHTDFGARLLVLATLKQIKENSTIFDQLSILRSAAKNAKDIGLDPSCLDATLLYVIGIPAHEHIKVIAIGDGVIAARKRSGEIESWEIDCGVAPAYSSYLLNEKRLNAYKSKGFDHGVRRCVNGVEEEILEFDVSDFSYENPCNALVLQLCPKEYDVILLLSDGVLTFFKKDIVGMTENIPLFSVLEQLMAFKSIKRGFIKRRCQRFLRHFCPAVGWSHYDDFSVAGIYCGGGEEANESMD